MLKLNRKFFNRDTLIVAKELLGKVLIFKDYQGIITETEAYIGQDDPACHAAKGLTKRNAIMYGEAGFSYVYFIYGMYYCLNIVTEKQGFPAAVLIRGIILASNLNLNGPGKLCKHLGITTGYNNIDLTSSDFFYLKDSMEKCEFVQTARIGIKIGIENLWRFKIKI